jgi:hypothetical protein
MRRVLATARPAHLPKTQTDHPAAVRPHQAQPRSQPLPPPRQDRRAHRMAVTDGHPQPHQAPPPPPRRRRAPTRPHAGETPPITTDTMATSKPPSNDPPTRPNPFSDSLRRGRCTKARKIAARAERGAISALTCGPVPVIDAIAADLTTVIPRLIDGPVFEPVCATASVLSARDTDAARASALRRAAAPHEDDWLLR